VAVLSGRIAAQIVLRRPATGGGELPGCTQSRGPALRSRAGGDRYARAAQALGAAELALAQVADHARGEVCEAISWRSSTADRADHDAAVRPAHGSGTVLGWPIAARNSSLAPDVHVVASSTAANPADS